MARTPDQEPLLPSARMSGFIAHLRLNSFTVGPGEACDALTFLESHKALDRQGAQLGLQSILAGNREQWSLFDELFDSYWLGRGVRLTAPPAWEASERAPRRPEVWDRRLPAPQGLQPQRHEAGAPEGDSAAEELEDAEEDAATRLLASRQSSLRRTDLRHLATADLREAEDIAVRLASAMRYRLTRRYRAARRGRRVDLRRTIRRSLGRGGDPIDLVRRRRPDRPVNIVAFVDVSGSMSVYSRVFLIFLRALTNRWARSDAYLFHTRLIRITDALRESDSLRAMRHLSLMAEGFGGGTKIAGCLKTFNDHYAKTAIDSRSVVIFMSDGYDTDPPEVLLRELKRLKRRARRIIWLNPLLGWRDYAPVARGMAAALPLIDCFAAANTLDGLAALEGEFARL